MGYRNVRRAYEEPEPGEVVSQNRYQEDRWTGFLEVLWRVDKHHPVAIGSGAIRLIEEGPKPPPPIPQLPFRPRSPGQMARTLRPMVEAEAAQKPTKKVVSLVVTRGGGAVFPGSSLKGAVRQAFEMLTPACYHEKQPRGRKRAPVRCPFPGTQAGGGEQWFCPACCFFGSQSLGGRVTFQEARGVPNEWFHELRTVPTAWEPDDEKVEDHCYRLYDLKPDRDDRGQLREEVEETQAVFGNFRSKVSLVNASDEELGLLFAALGVGERSPGIRLGGKKFHGLGAARVEILGAQKIYPRAVRLEGRALEDWIADLKRQALEKDGRLERYRELQSVISEGWKGEHP